MISVWKKVHAMKRLFIYRRDLEVCYVNVVVFSFFILDFFLCTFSLFRNNDFHVEAERMINVKKYLRRWFKTCMAQ